MRPETFQNPVIPGFHPDPSVCRVDEDYYLVCSSFEYFPGVPIFHSRDLVHWRQIGNVLDRPSQLALPLDTPASRGVYAPTIRHHDDRFWVITTNVTGGGNFLVTTDDPHGPWSDPVWIDLPGVDPDLAWDDDGNCWCSTSGIRQARIDPVTGEVLEGPWRTWSGTGLQYPESPHLYRVDDWWYLLVSEGGTDRGHAISVARGRTPCGPFDPAPGSPILTHSGTNLPIQSTGHSDLVTTPDGQWWLVLLGTRPRGHFPGFHVLGRETFLAPVRWEDDWPVLDLIVEQSPAPTAWHPVPVPAVRDDFDDSTLGSQWISPRGRPDGSWSLTGQPGRLTLHATGNSLDRPGCTFIGRRVQHLDARVSARLEPGAATAGLTVRRDEAHHYDIEVSGGAVAVIARIGPVRQSLATRPVRPGPITLTITFRTTDLLPPSVVRAVDTPTGVEPSGPDVIAFHVDDDPVPLAEVDGRYLSTEVATGFTGRVVGMYVTTGTARFDWYDYEDVPTP